MLTHVTGSGVVYEVAPPPEEVERRMAMLIRELYPTWLELRASAREAEDPRDVVGTSQPKILKTEYDASDWTQPRAPAHARAGGHQIYERKGG